MNHLLPRDWRAAILAHIEDHNLIHLTEYERSDCGDENCAGGRQPSYLVCGMTWANPATVTEIW